MRLNDSCLATTSRRGGLLGHLGPTDSLIDRFGGIRGHEIDASHRTSIWGHFDICHLLRIWIYLSHTLNDGHQFRVDWLRSSVCFFQDDQRRFWDVSWGSAFAISLAAWGSRRICNVILRSLLRLFLLFIEHIVQVRIFFSIYYPKALLYLVYWQNRAFFIAARTSSETWWTMTLSRLSNFSFNLAISAFHKVILANDFNLGCSVAWLWNTLIRSASFETFSRKFF